MAATSSAEYSNPHGNKAQTVPSSKGALRPPAPTMARARPQTALPAPSSQTGWRALSSKTSPSTMAAT